MSSPTIYANERTWFEAGEYLASDHVIVHVSSEKGNSDIEAYLKIVTSDSQINVVPSLWANGADRLKQEERALHNAHLLEKATRIYREALETAINARRGM